MIREINLLPQVVQRQRMRWLYLFRIGRFLNRVYVLLFLLIVVLVGTLYVMRSIDDGVVRDNEVLVDANDDVVREVRWLNQVLGEFEKRQVSYTPWSPRVLEVLMAAPNEVRLTGFIVKEESQNVLVVSGVSSSRPAVVDFQQRLEQLDWVKQVEAPLQNFALATEASFTFSLHRR